MDGSQASDQLPRFIVLKNELGEETKHYNTVSRDCPEDAKLYAEKVLNETEENRLKGLEKIRTFTKNGSQTNDELPRFIILKNELGEETKHYNTVSRDCPEEVKQYAEKVLNETEENKRKGLEKLRAFSKKEKLLELEEPYLIAVLRCCKYDIKKSETKLKKFLNVRRMAVKNLKRLNDKKIEKIISDGFTDCLPWSDKDGRPIYVFRPNIDLDTYDYKDMAAYAQCCLFSVLTYPLPTIKGSVAIVDCNVESPVMVLQMVNEYRKYIGLEKTVPSRIGRIDFVNSNPLVQSVFAVLRPLLPTKIVQRVAFHGSDLTKLHKIYHPAILPEDFGGTLGPVDTNLFKEEKLKILYNLMSENI